MCESGEKSESMGVFLLLSHHRKKKKTPSCKRLFLKTEMMLSSLIFPKKILPPKASQTRRRGETSFFVTSLSQGEEEGALLTLSLISVLISIWETAFQKLSFQKQSTLHHRRCS